MSKIEDRIAAERSAALKKHEDEEETKKIKRAKLWEKWVGEEQPRIAAFTTKINKLFPCLEGDFTVSPRSTPNDLDAYFVAVVKVKDCNLEIRQTYGKDNYTLFTPYYSTRGYGWGEYNWDRHEILSNKNLKEQIARFISQKSFEEAESRRYYDSLPIGNTD
jgi:hypothetical protein